jgi:hypothetical protein
MKKNFYWRFDLMDSYRSWMKNPRGEDCFICNDDIYAFRNIKYIYIVLNFLLKTKFCLNQYLCENSDWFFSYFNLFSLKLENAKSEETKIYIICFFFMTQQRKEILFNFQNIYIDSSFIQWKIMSIFFTSKGFHFVWKILSY